VGQIEIVDKLNRELQKDICEECQIVYILSKIRKILEINDDEKNRYKYLKFYCDWSLHPKIDRTESVKDFLCDFIEGSDDGKFLKFDHFYNDFKNFIKEHQLSEKILEKNTYIKFINLLLEVLSETPVEVHLEEKRTIVIKKPKKTLSDSVFSIEYTIA
jgi:hypothetical protein